MSRDQTAHIAEAIHNKPLVLLSCIAGTNHALAHHVVGIVGVYALLCVLQLASKVDVVHRDLAQRESAIMTMHIRHLLVHKRTPARQRFLDEKLDGGIVEYIADCAFTQLLRVSVFIRKIIWIEKFASLRIVDIKFATHKADIHLMYIAAKRFVRQYRQTTNQQFRLVINLPLVLITKLATNQTAIPLIFVLVHLLPKAESTRGESMSVFATESFNGLCHLFPVVFAAKYLLRRCSAII